MTNEELYKLALEHITYDIPYSTQALIAELATKLKAAEEDVEHICRTCWYRNNNGVYEDVCTGCCTNWWDMQKKTNWKWRYDD